MFDYYRLEISLEVSDLENATLGSHLRRGYIQSLLHFFVLGHNNVSIGLSFYLSAVNLEEAAGDAQFEAFVFLRVEELEDVLGGQSIDAVLRVLEENENSLAS